jgi:hypothetical protein
MPNFAEALWRHDAVRRARRTPAAILIKTNNRMS